jgi:MFS family permease
MITTSFRSISQGRVLCRALSGLFAGSATCTQAYIGSISKTPEERSSRVAALQAVSSVAYVCGPGLGGALHAIGTMVCPFCSTEALSPCLDPYLDRQP